MKKNILYLFIILNLIFYSNMAISKVVTNKIYIGKTTSLTGKNSSNAIFFNSQHDKDIKNINNYGGVEVGGKTYQFEIIYYDDESNNYRANNLITRLILNEGVQFIIVPNNIKLHDSVKDTIKKYQVSIMSSKEAIYKYKDALETVNSFDGKKINNFLLENK